MVITFGYDEPYGESVGSEPAKQMMEKVYVKFPDIHVTVEDILAEGDKVMVRNVWRVTDPALKPHRSTKDLTIYLLELLYETYHVRTNWHGW